MKSEATGDATGDGDIIGDKIVGDVTVACDDHPQTTDSLRR
jgi:hypothetical protein